MLTWVQFFFKNVSKNVMGDLILYHVIQNLNHPEMDPVSREVQIRGVVLYTPYMQ